VIPDYGPVYYRFTITVRKRENGNELIVCDTLLGKTLRITQICRYPYLNRMVDKVYTYGNCTTHHEICMMGTTVDGLRDLIGVPSEGQNPIAFDELMKFLENKPKRRLFIF